MEGKKIIDKKNVKNRNANDDEEVFKNPADEKPLEKAKNDGDDVDADDLKNENEKAQNADTIGIP